MKLPVLALAAAVVAFATAAQAADYVLRDRTGKRVEIIEEGVGGSLVRRDLQGRRLGYVEPSPTGVHVLRDERGRRIGTIRGGVRDPAPRAFGERPPGRVDSALDSGVVRDRTGRRIGTIGRG